MKLQKGNYWFLGLKDLILQEEEEQGNVIKVRNSFLERGSSLK